jgi:hypothetical protein
VVNGLGFWDGLWLGLGIGIAVGFLLCVAAIAAG